jgi:hypothetical protein
MQLSKRLRASLVFEKVLLSRGVDRVGCDAVLSGIYLQMFSEEHFLDLENAGSMLLWNVGKFLPYYPVALGKIWSSLQSGADVLHVPNVFLAYRPAVFCAAQ